MQIAIHLMQRAGNGYVATSVAPPLSAEGTPREGAIARPRHLVQDHFAEGIGFAWKYQPSATRIL
jgi:hypothetical protein